MSERSGELRIQCANYALPSLPTYPSLPEEQNYSPSTPSERSSTRDTEALDGWTITVLLALADYLDRVEVALTSVPGHLRWLADGSTDLVAVLGLEARPIDAEAGPVPVVRPVVVAGARSAEEIRALCEAATPGPWSFHNGDLWAGATAEELALADRLAAEHAYSDEVEDIFDRASHLFHGDPVRPEDAAFIAAARELVPSLLAEVERLQDVRRKVTADWELACGLLGERTSELERLLAERDSLRGVVQAVEAERDAARAEANRFHAEILAIWRWCERNVQGGTPPVVRNAGRRSAALAAAADAPQPQPAAATKLGLHDPWDAECSRRCHGEPTRSYARCTVCRPFPSPAVLPETEQQR